MIDAVIVGLVVLLIRKAWPGLRKPRILIGLAVGLGVGLAAVRRRPLREGIVAGLGACGLYDLGQTFIGEGVRKSELVARFIPLPCLNP